MLEPNSIFPEFTLASIPSGLNLSNIYKNVGIHGVDFKSNLAIVDLYLNKNYYLKSLKIFKQKRPANVIVFLYRNNSIVDTKANSVLDSFLFTDFSYELTDKISVFIESIDRNSSSINNVKLIPTVVEPSKATQLISKFISLSIKINNFFFEVNFLLCAEKNMMVKAKIITMQIALAKMRNCRVKYF